MARRRRNRAEDEAAQLRKARREMLRDRKIAQERRKLTAALAPIILFVVGLVAYGWFRLEYWQPRQPVARVVGTAIQADDYGKRVQFARRQTLNNLSNLLGFLQSTDPSFIQSYVEQQRTGIAQQTLDTMIDEVLIQAEANERGITVTDDEVEERICAELSTAVGATADDGDDATDEDAAEGEDEAGDGEEAAEDAAEVAEEAEDAADEAADEVADAAEEQAEEDADAAGDDEGAAELVAEAADEAGDAGEEIAEEAEDAADEIADEVADAGDALTDDGESDEDAASEDEPEDDTLATIPDEPVCALEGAELDRTFERILDPQLEQAGMNRRDYEKLVRAQLFSTKFAESLGEELDTTAEQAEIEYMLFIDDGVADQASAALAAGDDWDDVVARFQRPEEPDVDADELGVDPAAELDGVEVGDEDGAADDAEAVDDEAADAAEEAAEEAEDAADEAADEAADAEDEAADEAADAAEEQAEGDEGLVDEVADEVGDAAEEIAEEAEDAAEEIAEEAADAADEVGDELADAAEEIDEALEGDEDGDEEGDAEGDDAAEEAAEGDEEPEAAPTPMPTPEPEPFFYEMSEASWYTAEQIRTRLGLTQAEVDAAFAMEPGSVTEPLDGSQGAYILRVLDVAEDREIDEAELQRLKDGALEGWLADARLEKSSEISRFPTTGLVPAEPDWFVQGYNQLTSSLGSAPPLDLGGTTGGSQSP